MRLMTFLLAAVLSTGAVAAETESAWSWSALPGEERRSILSCSTGSNDHAWVCLALRCEKPNGIVLYAELTNLTLDNRFDLDFGATRITVWGRSHEPETPYSNRIDGPIDAILTAMRANDSVTIDRPAEPINPAMAAIPLAGATAAIDALIAACTPDASGG